ncbi:MAG: L-lysine dehydrogenase [Alphaproteobacteria bacterium]|nr:MAG: L-lysine dehydrogenase [Alphaproteobacteria bacterium]
MAQEKIKNILVLGLGRVGVLVATLLHETGYKVTGADAALSEDFPFNAKELDVSDPAKLQALMKDNDAIVSCLPFFLNKDIARLAVEEGLHYFDLTEDVPTTQYILELAKDAKTVLAPQCGLAPGFIGIVGAYLARDFKKIRHMKLRVGALPQHPTGHLGYAFNWSPEGVINEYLNDCEVVERGQKKLVSPLEWLEKLFINGQELEAFTTSGGLGTMCDTYIDRVENLDYKSIRYPGHAKMMNFLLHELFMRENLQETAKVLSHAKPPVSEDIVYVHASVEGWNKHDKLLREEFINGYLPKVINGRQWRAISWTTAASVCSVIEMVDTGKLSDHGFIRQEDIPFDDFLETRNGQLYKKRGPADTSIEDIDITYAATGESMSA